MEMSMSKLREIVKDREAWRAAVCGVTESLRWLSDWTTTVWFHEYDILEKNYSDRKLISYLHSE